MNALDQMNAYLHGLERRLRLLALSRGVAVNTAVALGFTILLVLILNAFAFSRASVFPGRVVLFVALALAAAFGLVIPLFQINRRRAALRAEGRFPEFQERLLTLSEKPPEGPFAELIAADALPIARSHKPEQLASLRRIAALFASAGVAAFVLLWLILAAPGFLGYGSALLWAGTTRDGGQPLYQVIVSPGNRSVRRHSDQLVTARLLGFNSSKVHLFAQYRGTSKWDQVTMLPRQGSPSYEFLFGGLPETVEYYVQAGAVRSPAYTLRVVDLPAVKHVRVLYHFPGWSGMKDATEDPGGDLRALEGTEAEVSIQTDKPLASGALLLDNGKEVSLVPGAGNWSKARVRITEDGMYHVAAIDSGERVRLSEDYFIEARKDSPPSVRITRPERDAQVNPVEEVPVAIAAGDEFGLQDVALHYSVNGGEEKTRSLLSHKGAKESSGNVVLALEDYKLSPGDIISFYATARGPRIETKSDIFFIQAEPFEREYSQAQSGGAGGGGGPEQGEISERQKEIITATFNQIRNGAKDTADAAEQARFLSNVQIKLGEQARSLSERMKSREIAGTNQEFQDFSKSMDKAAEAMAEATVPLKSQKWRNALAPEETALQNLLRAEAVFRQIQVAFGNQNGGGGGGMGRDLARLFDLELDTEKNQYETGQQQAAADKRAKELDDIMQKLEELARRQQELAAQKDKQQTFEQRWQQEMLRREAEQLRRQMEEAAQQSSSRRQSSQSGQQSGQQSDQQSDQQSSQQSSSSSSSRGSQSSSQQSSQSSSGSAGSARTQEALQRLSEATREMSRAASGQDPASQRRAAQSLAEARDLLKSFESKHASEDVAEMARKAGQIGARQKESANRLLRAYGDESGGNTSPQSSTQNERLAAEKDKIAQDLKRLEQQMEQAARNLNGGRPDVSSKLKEALGDMQQNELALRMNKQAEWIRHGYGASIWLREAPISHGLDKLNEQLQAAQGMLAGNGKPGEAPSQSKLESALSEVQQMREQLEESARSGRGSGRAMSGSFTRLRQSLGGSPEFSGDLQQIMRDAQNLTGLESQTLMSERIRTSVLPDVERLELRLRRELGVEGVRTQGLEPVPEGYSDAVAEYFRKLSHGK